MKPKQLLTVLLLVFATASIAYMIAREYTTANSTTQEQAKAISAPRKTPPTENIPVAAGENIRGKVVGDETENDNRRTQFVVYYFHGDVRCPTCHKLENYAKEALDTYFPEELASKTILWKPVNVDKPQNSHFVEDYKLVTKSVVLCEIRDGKQHNRKNLDQIWQKIRDKESYLQYIHQSILRFLEESLP